jgi:hypothetical protein
MDKMSEIVRKKGTGRTAHRTRIQFIMCGRIEKHNVTGIRLQILDQLIVQNILFMTRSRLDSGLELYDSIGMPEILIHGGQGKQQPNNKGARFR